ncbi:hypothetical protein JW905_18505, partial [bacterium]|nr:hypothetical protein [candidate division CSSED10-310 bacterium]
MRSTTWFMTVFMILTMAVTVGATASPVWHPINTSEPAAADLTILEASLQRLHMDLELSGLEFIETSIEGQGFVQMSLPDAGQTSELGKPRLPVYRRFIEVPRCEDVRLEFRVVNSERFSLTELGFDGLRIAPVVPPVPKTTARDNVKLVIEEKYYEIDRFLPDRLITLGDTTIARGHQLRLLEVFPVAYNAVSGELEVVTGIDIDITFRNADFNTTVTALARTRSPVYEQMINHVTVNSGRLADSRDFPPPAPVSYLIITADMFMDSLTPFIAWKESCGYEVAVAKTSEIGSTTGEIQTYIQTAYDTWPNPPVYVLLVGDTNSIPAFNGPHSYTETDLYYSTTEGGDLVPELMIGRWPGRTTAHIDAMVAKTMTFQSTDVGDLTFYGEGVFIASDDQGGMAEDTHNFVIANYLEPDGLNPHRVWASQGGSTADIANNLNAGRSWCVYSGHGSPSGWACVPYDISDVEALSNPGEYPIVNSHACSTNTYEDENCFGESWLRVANKGGVCFWGASNSTYWDEDDYLEKAHFRGLVEEQLYSEAAATNYGKYDLVEIYGWVSRVQYYYDAYVIHGDPSIDPFTRVPTSLTATHLPNAPVGLSDFVVEVNSAGAPMENAMVCLKMGTNVFAVAYTDAMGQAVLSINPIEPGFMDITVTAHNHIPYTDQIQVMTTGCGIIMLDRELYACDSVVTIHVWDADLNLNPGAPDLATADMSSDSEPTPEVVTLVETGDDTAEFVGTITLSEGNGGPGFLLVSHGDTITAVYHDADCEGSPQDVQDEATGDCEAPLISGVSFTNVLDSTATINWTTNELSDSVVYYGLTTPPAMTASVAGWVTNHSVELTGLDSCAKYYFAVSSMDASGNEVIDDNGGAYYFFNTLGLFTLLEANMDENPLWTISGGQWAWGTPTGQGGAYGDPDPTTGATGNNVYGYNLNGDYADGMPVYTLTTPAFDCSSAIGTTLSFQRWLGVESSSYDHAVLSISTNGSTWTELFHNGASMSDGAWTAMEYDLSAYADGQSTVYLRWT